MKYALMILVAISVVCLGDDNLSMREGGTSQEGLILSYDFETGVSDDLSPDENDGTLVGGVTFVGESGTTSGYMDFNGSSGSITCSWALLTSKAFIVKDYTFSVWVKRERIGTLEYIWSYRDSTGNNNYNEISQSINFQVDNTARVVHRYATNAVGKLNLFLVTSSQTVGLGEWVNFVMVHRNEESLQLYINGEFEVEDTVMSSSGSNKNEFTGRVGALQLIIGTPRYYDGPIDEINIWQRAMSTNEIEQLYHYAKPRHYTED